MLIRYPRGFDHLPGGFPDRRVLCSSRRRPETKNPACFHMPGFQFWRRPTLARPIAVLPSGLQRFTAVFGMGTGGATALLSPEPRSADAPRLWCVIRDSLHRVRAGKRLSALGSRLARRYLAASPAISLAP